MTTLMGKALLRQHHQHLRALTPGKAAHRVLLYNPETTNPAKVTEMTSVVAWRWPEDHEGGLESGTKRLGGSWIHSFSLSIEGATGIRVC